MPLQFEYDIELDTGTQPFICHEEDSSIYNYYIDDALAAIDTSSSIHEGHYESVAFSNPDRHLTTRAVDRIGIKNFPGIGAIGFYKDAYSDESRIVAPILIEGKRYDAPTITTAEIVDDKLHIVIQPAEDISYTCYRVIVRQQQFAFEYITYKTECFVDKPTVKGDYIVYCIGYDENNGTVSEDSNDINLTVLDGTDDWKPYITELDYITEELDDHEERITELEENPPGGKVAQYLIGATFEVNGATSISCSISTSNGVLLVAFVVHRSTLTQYTQGWTLLYTGAEIVSSENTHQYISILYKYAESLSDTLVVNQQSAGRMYVNILQFATAGIPEMYLEPSYYTNVATSPINVIKAVNDVVVFSLHTITYSTESPPPLWTTVPNNKPLVQVHDTGQPRLLSVVDAGDADAFTINHVNHTSEVCLIGIKIKGAS